MIFMIESLQYWFVKLFFKLIKDYTIFFLVEDGAYYVNDIMIDTETKDIVMKYVERREESN